MSTYNAQQKLDAVEREIRMRRRVYPRWVSERRMTQARADAEIAVMEEIAADYRAQASGERLL